jgi:beta-lactam-binding protein with PASTA domain/predicted Ser/Thr protein kinase
MTLPKSVGGRYELGELLGYGGMAEVHRGRDVRLGRDVAVKVLRADLARDPSFQNRFRREAQAAAGLNHPSIVAVYDTGEDLVHNGTEDVVSPYIVMEYVEGRTLREVLKSEGQLPIRRAMEITAEVCSALDFSHRSGIVHRDVKPGNVMITKAGAVKVMDFGIARALADNAATVTATAAVIGTAQYLSPEQARGESVDARSDVYSTGCLLYELVTGHPPFTGDSPVAVAYQHVRENPRIPSSVNSAVPRELDSIIMKALAKNPLNRYQTAAEMRSDLQRAIEGQRVEAETVMTEAERTQLIATPRNGQRPPSGPAILDTEDEPAEERRSHRGAIIWALVVVVLLAAIGGTGYFVVRHKDKNTAAPLVAVPELQNLTPAAATAAITGAGFVVGSSTVKTNGPCTDTSTTVGNVCTQSQAAQSQLAKGSMISFTLYAGLANVNVPAVTGIPYTTAVQTLDAVPLYPTQVQVNNSAAAGIVISQNPVAGTSVAPKSGVTLTVSTGKISLQDVTHRDKASAQRTLNQAGFTNVTLTQTTLQAGFIAGQVESQNPTAGYYDPSVPITLFYAGPATTTPTTCAPSTTPPASPSVSPGASATAGDTTSPVTGATTATSTSPTCTP